MTNLKVDVIDYIKFECFFKLPDVNYECILMSQYDTTITVNGHGYTTHNRETDFNNICDLAKRIIKQHHDDDIVDNDEYWVLTVGYTIPSLTVLKDIKSR